MTARLLAVLVAQVIAMGLLHLILSRRGAFKPVAFCAGSGLALAALGLAALWPSLAAQVRLSPWTLLWAPAFGLGFLSAGSVLGLAWIGLVRGGAAWLRR